MKMREIMVQRINKRVKNYAQGPSLMPVNFIVVDAGLLYTIALLVNIITFASKSNGQYIILDMIPPITPTAFYMIIIRVGVVRGALSSDMYFKDASIISPPPQGQGSGIPMPSLEVHIMRIRENDTESQGQYTKEEFPTERSRTL